MSVRTVRTVGSQSCLAWAACLLAGGLAIVACRAEDARSSSEPRAVGSVAQDLRATNIFGRSLPAKTLALTFDDGPGTRTIELSRYLRAEGIRATFFVNGAIVAPTTLPNPNGVDLLPGAAATLAELARDGHLVANHTTTHRNLVTQVLPTGALRVVQELTETHDVISAHVPSGRFLFRAPYGAYDTAVYTALRGSAMNEYVGPVNWDVGGVSDNYPAQAADWACWDGQLYAGPTKVNGTGYATTRECGDAYLTEIGAVGRGIVLMHDPYGWAGGHTVDMVKYLVPLLKADGYAFVRADEVPAIAALLPPLCDATCATCSGPLPTECVTCGGGRHLAAGTCAPCSVCADGTYQTAACAPSSDTACAACDPTCATCTGGGPSRCATCPLDDYRSGGSCRPCTTCAPGSFEVSRCTSTTDSVCSACDASCSFCSGPAPTDCTTCPSGSYLAGGVCKKCSMCAPGSFESSACLPESDTSCATCAPGAVSGDAGSKACTPCAPGSAPNPSKSACVPCLPGYFASGGASSCALCPPGTSSGAGAATCAPIPAPPTSDAGAGELDAATPPLPDAGGGPVAAAPPVSEEGGCSVSSTRPEGSGGATVAVVLATFFVRARRRRARALALR